MAELQNLPVTEQPGSVGGATQVPVAEQPAPLAQRMVSWEPNTHPSRTHPPCQAPISVPQSKEELEKYLAQLHSLCNKVKKKVKILEQINEENFDTLAELESKYESHAAKFQQLEEQ